MSSTTEVEHDIVVSAPAESVYRLLAEVENWPRIFPPTIYVDTLERDADRERIRIWALANDEPKNWASVRTLDPTARRIEFRQVVTTPPVAAMGGTWILETLGEEECRVRLLHDYRAVDDDPASLQWIHDAVDRNSNSELAALKDNLEAAHAAEELTFSFSDSVHVRGAAKDVFDVINEADRWEERLPHVARVRLTEDQPGLQKLEMDTRAVDGTTHTTVSYRVTFPDRKIAYKQVTLPLLMTLHTGVWTFEDDEDGVVATSQHTVVLQPATIGTVLGPQAGVADARAYVHKALSTNSLATLNRAKELVEERERP